MVQQWRRLVLPLLLCVHACMCLIKPVGSFLYISIACLHLRGNGQHHGTSPYLDVSIRSQGTQCGCIRSRTSGFSHMTKQWVFRHVVFASYGLLDYTQEPCCIGGGMTKQWVFRHVFFASYG